MTATIEPLNLILYGPPGTGKTFGVAEEVLKRLDSSFLSTNPTVQAIQAQYARLVQAGRVTFLTFHQNFTYEDFVEGIKPVTDPETQQVTYERQDGIFKSIADRAAAPAVARVAPELNVRGRVWKLSIDGTGPHSTIRKYCLDHDEARIGYAEHGNLALAENLRGAPRQFAEEMGVGDLVLCIAPNTTVQAVGVVTGEYRYDENPPAHVTFRNVRPVKWLDRGLDVSFRDLLGRPFTLAALYGLPDVNVPQALAHLESHGAHLGEQEVAPEPHVLVIDEINRGNIAKIFGELITLIEPSKRAGRPEAITVSLPYSKKDFSVPDTLYIVATMNTADRSLALLDTALRRRFEFREVPPRPELLHTLTEGGIDLRRLLFAMNRRIELLYDRDHALGHAYLLDLGPASTVADLARVFRSRVLPLLEEYFFEDWGRIAQVLDDGHKADEDRIVVELPDQGQWLPDARGAVRAYRVNEAALLRPGAYSGIYNGVPSGHFPDW